MGGSYCRGLLLAPPPFFGNNVDVKDVRKDRCLVTVFSFFLICVALSKKVFHKPKATTKNKIKQRKMVTSFPEI